MTSIKKEELQLYAISNRGDKEVEEFLIDLEESIKGGITLLQLREKDVSFSVYLEVARQVKALCDSYGIHLIINDDVHIAKEVDAYGVHLGAEDLEIEKARKVLGPNKIIGATAKTKEEALKAQEAGADYLGAGDVFGTKSKSDAKRISLDELKQICESVKIPVVAIGGVNHENVMELKGTGISGISVIGALYSDEDVYERTVDLLEKVQKIV